MFQTGFTDLFKIKGAKVRVHWSIAIGLLFFGGFRFSPGFWLGYLILIFAHEFGHALLVWRYKLRVLSIDVVGFGGWCQWTGGATQWERAAIAWGGVLAQAAIIAIMLALEFALGPWQSVFMAQMHRMLVELSALLILINLLPLNGLDGGTAWKLPKLAKLRWQKRRVDRELKRVREKKKKAREAGESGAKVVHVRRSKDGGVEVVHDSDLLN